MTNCVYLGIDASKGYSDFIVLKSNKDVAEQAFRLYDVSEGYIQLSKLIDGWFKKDYDHIYCGVESTGGYENNWVNYLQELSLKKPLSIVRLNPKAVKSLGEAALRSWCRLWFISNSWTSHYFGFCTCSEMGGTYTCTVTYPKLFFEQGILYAHNNSISVIDDKIFQ